MLGKEKDQPFSLRRRPARSEAERNTEMVLVQVAPNAKLTSVIRIYAQ